MGFAKAGGACFGRLFFAYGCFSINCAVLPSYFLTETRMGQAMTLLTSTDMKTATVAEAVGIPDPSYFSYVFKRSYGLSPSQVRKRREGEA